MSDIDKAMSAVDAHVNRVVRKVSLQALKGCVLKTPVDTGRARGNWSVGLNTRPMLQVETEDKGGGKAIATGSAQVAQAKTYGEVYVVNNVDYIERLEDGSSKQAPQGMVKVTAAEIEAQARALAKG